MVNIIEVAKRVGANSGNLRDTRHTGEQIGDSRVRVRVNTQRLGWDAHIASLLEHVDTPYFVILPHDDVLTPAQLLAAVERAKELIAAGDFMQVQVGQRIQKRFTESPLSLYRALRSLNPSPYMYYYHFGDFHVVGASPEILVRSEDRQGKRIVAIRPIAGTRPRGSTPEQDAELATELAADPKERAEHLMLVDLGRNDVGRVATYGSVKVPTYMALERYSHVMHLVSVVEGKLDDHHDRLDALVACFPAGTVSGAPKVRAMEIIAELENRRRGVYAGAVGYVDFAGNLDFCIAIRTVVIENGGGYDDVPRHSEDDEGLSAHWQEGESCVGSGGSL